MMVGGKSQAVSRKTEPIKNFSPKKKKKATDPFANKPPNVVAYIRVSSPKQVSEGESLVAQDAELSRFCSKQGLKILKVFADPGVTGTIDNRRGFMAMMDYCKKNAANLKAVVITKISRYFRNTLHHLNYRHELCSIGIRFLSPNYDFKLYPDADEIMVSAQAQKFSEELREYGKQSALTTLAKGRLNWKAPIGYLNKRDPQRARGTIVVHDPVAAPIIAELFSLFVNTNRPRSELKKWADRRGLVNPQTGKTIASGTFYKIFGNPAYAGLIHNEKLGWIEAEFEPIISRELFEKAQEKVNNTGRSNIVQKTGPGDFPLKGTIRCASCRVILSGSKPNRRKYRYYHFYKHVPGCKLEKVNISADKAEAGFVKVLMGLRSSNVLGELMELVSEDMQTLNRSRIQDELAQCEEEIEEQEDMIDRLYEMNARGEIDSDRCKKLLTENMAKLEELKLQKGSAESKIVPLEYCKKQAVWSLDHLDLPWQASDNEGKAEFAKALFPDGVTCDKQGRIEVLGNGIQSGLIKEMK